MKRVLIIVLLAITQKIWAQNDCVHGVSTNPVNPKNNSLPNTANGSGSNFLNSFNWLPIQNDGTWAPYQLTNTIGNNQIMQSLYSNQVSDYYDYINQDDKPVPQNGWELLLLNIGAFPNGSSNPNLNFKDVPYIVLYNRYKGVIRIFANYGEGYLPAGISIDAVKVELGFTNNSVSGLLRLNKGNDQALDQVTLVTKTVALAQHPNSPGKWFSTDIQVAFDPCSCHFPSNLRLNFQFNDTETLELHGRQISIEQDLITGNAIADKDYLSGFNYSGNTADGGVLMYEALNSLTNDYEIKLQAYQGKLAQVNIINASLERNIVINKAFKHIVISGGSAAITAVSGMPWFGALLKYANDVVGKEVLKKDDIIREAKKGLASELTTFIDNNFGKVPSPTSPGRPSATFSEMHFMGELKNTVNIAGPAFFNPGTYSSSGTGSPQLQSVFEYPVYNEILGSFALLESPKIVISSTDKDYYESSPYTRSCVLNPDPKDHRQCTFIDYIRTKNIQFQLKDNLKYAYNTALDIKSTKIEAAFIIRAKTNDPYVSTNYNVEKSVQKLHPHYLVNLSSTKYDGYTNSLIEKDGILNLQTPFVPIDAFKPMVSSVGIKSYFTKMQCDYWGGCSPTYFAPLDPIKISDMEIELKLIVDIEFNTLRSDGTNNATTQILTYKVRPEDIFTQTNDIYSNLAGSNKNITQFPENLILKSTVFDGSHVNGFLLSGKQYKCKAYNNITIDGDLSTTGGYYVDIVAGNEIYMGPNSSIGTNINLNIEPVLDYSTPMPQSTQAYVTNFCKGLNANAPVYAAKTSFYKSLEENAEDNPNSSIILTNVSNYGIYPNPNNGFFTLNVESENCKNIYVYDLLGKVVYQKMESKAQKFDIDITDQSKGIYIIKVVDGDNVKMFKVVNE